MTEVEKINEIISAIPDGKKAVIYFIGIGGIGMSALARYFHFKGQLVSGYDRTDTDITRQLSSEGIAVHFEDNMELAPKNPDMVVYTPAVPASHKELSYYRELQFPVVKRSDVLGAITRSSYSICVAGTHGKTTISTMTGHVLRDSGYGCSAFLGGISVNYNTNFWSDKRNVCVAEADEYDRSFLKLSPDVAVISAMDADHLDIYGTVQHMQDAFIDFSRKIRSGGLLITKYGLPRREDMTADLHVTYGLQDAHADVTASEIKLVNGGYEFAAKGKDWEIQNVELKMGGMHNVENALAAITIAQHLGIDEQRIKGAIKSFKGVKRRFEYVVHSEKIVYIDDYAHHPQELRALIRGARELFTDRHCTIIFQPHLYSRTRDLYEEFAAALALADQIVLLPIYPARELPIKGVSSEMILEQLDKLKTRVLEKEDLVPYVSQLVEKREPMLLITAGAGDIDTLVPSIARAVMESK